MTLNCGQDTTKGRGKLSFKSKRRDKGQKREAILGKRVGFEKRFLAQR